MRYGCCSEQQCGYETCGEQLPQATNTGEAQVRNRWVPVLTEAEGFRLLYAILQSGDEESVWFGDSGDRSKPPVTLNKQERNMDSTSAPQNMTQDHLQLTGAVN